MALHPRWACAAALVVLLTACSRPSAQEQQQRQALGGTTAADSAAPPAQVAPAAPKPSDDEAAAAAMGLKPEQVLSYKSFEGGALGQASFPGGIVLLWESEPDQLTAQAVYVQDGVWTCVGPFSHQMVGPDNARMPFVANGWPINRSEPSERKVPLWAFFGKSYDPRIRTIEVDYPGFTVGSTSVGPKGTWLIVYQGMIAEQGPDGSVLVIARDATQAEVGRQTLAIR